MNRINRTYKVRTIHFDRFDRSHTDQSINSHSKSISLECTDNKI